MIQAANEYRFHGFAELADDATARLMRAMPHIQADDAAREVAAYYSDALHQYEKGLHERDY